MGLVFFELQSVIAHPPAERHPTPRQFNYWANRKLDEYRVMWGSWSPAEKYILPRMYFRFGWRKM